MKDGCHSKLTITKSGHRATQIKKILHALPGFFKDKNYKYIDDIISTNTKPTQVYFLLVYPVRTQRSSMHHVNLGSVNSFIGLDVPSGKESSHFQPKYPRTCTTGLQSGVKTEVIGMG